MGNRLKIWTMPTVPHVSSSKESNPKGIASEESRISFHSRRAAARKSAAVVINISKIQSWENFGMN